MHPYKQMENYVSLLITLSIMVQIRYLTSSVSQLY